MNPPTPSAVPFHQCRIDGHPHDEHDPAFLRHANEQHSDPPHDFAWCCWIGGYHSRDAQIDQLTRERDQAREERDAARANLEMTYNFFATPPTDNKEKE